MTDLHTHILPGMDDGSKDPAMSIRMLIAQREQGVGTVALTSHFYPDTESPDHFLKRRAAAWDTLRAAIDALPAEERDKLPRLSLGAEVAWAPRMSEWGRAEELCYSGTNLLMIELPFERWDVQLHRLLYDFMRSTGLEAVIAHIDRYFKIQTPSALKDLYALNLRTQISAEAFTRFSTRSHALKTVREGHAQLLISDCHNMTGRPPNLRPAMDIMEKKLGREVRGLFDYADELLEN